MRIVVALVFFLMFFSSLQAQVDLRTVFEPDSAQSPTKLAHIKIVILKPLRQGVKLTAPRTALNWVKPVLARNKRYVPQSFWNKSNTLGINISEVAFVNWNAGGNDAVSVLAEGHFARNYKFRYLNWNNTLQLRYGLNSQEGRKLRKTDDQLRFSSTLSFRNDTLTPWYYSVNVNFNTQFSDGFEYPNRVAPISRFMAPGYLFLGLGKSYLPPRQELTLYLSPVTLKATFVLDDGLSDQGAFGVARGEQVFSELGFLITNRWNKEVIKNVVLDHLINVYTDYLSSFGNIDVDWQLNVSLKVNDFIEANVGTHVIYDDDIRFGERFAEDGTVLDSGTPRIQFKQLLGLGVRYTF